MTTEGGLVYRDLVHHHTLTLRASGLRLLLGSSGLCACLLAARLAAAHPAPGSVAFVDFTVDGALLEQDVPLEELERALHQRLMREGEAPADAVRRQARFLSTYAAQHLRASSLDTQQPWRLRSLGLQGHSAPDGPRARFQFAFDAPAGDASGSVNLYDDIVVHEVVSHYTTLYVRSDWPSGAEAREPQLIGVIHAGRNAVLVERQGSFAHGLFSIVRLGMEHIATGTDHLLFLLALVLVAPVSALRGAWRERKSTRDTLSALARVVSAFTLGHSATLALGVLGGMKLPSAAVEAAIAASILVTAGHAVRPLFPRREALVAGAFGLVHGLAFASTLAGRDLGRVQAAWTLLGFNTGIELAQLGLLALVVPWLLMTARTRGYELLRLGGAGVAAVFGLGWLLERTTTASNPTAPALAWLETHPLALLFAFAAFAVLARLHEYAASRRPPPTACPVSAKLGPQ